MTIIADSLSQIDGRRYQSGLELRPRIATQMIEVRGRIMAAGLLFFYSIATESVACGHGNMIFSASLGRPCLLLGGLAEDVPESNQNVIWLPYLHLAVFLRHCSAIVHHGGIGTSAAALAAGIPQVMVPRIFGQHANADRLSLLGVSQTISFDNYSKETVTSVLRNQIESASVASCCSDLPCDALTAKGLTE